MFAKLPIAIAISRILRPMDFYNKPVGLISLWVGLNHKNMEWGGLKKRVNLLWV
jgi:hypothetical protein